MPRNRARGQVLDSHQELTEDLQAALEDKARGMNIDGVARKHRITKERLRAAIKCPQGSRLMQRIKREMKLPDRLGKDELLYKIQKWIEREEVKEDAKLPDLVGAAMNYARLCGYLEPAKLTVNQNTVNVAADVSFASVLQSLRENTQPAIECAPSANDAIDV